MSMRSAGFGVEWAIFISPLFLLVFLVRVGHYGKADFRERTENCQGGEGIVNWEVRGSSFL
jgi:hypothetical protein